MSSTVRMIFILILVMIILAAALAFWYINQSFKVSVPGGESVLAAEAKPSKGKKPSYAELGSLTFSTEQILTNLKSGHIIRTQFTFLVDDKEAIEELTARHFQVNSVILSLLHEKMPGDLTGEAGLNRLENEIKERINAFLESGEVVEVYTSETILQ